FMAKYRAALIGLGRKATTSDRIHLDHPVITVPYTHMAAYTAHPDIEVVAGCDLYEKQRETFQQNWGVEGLYADYQEMFAVEKPDIVSVTTKTSTRYQIVLDAARAGVRAIYAEKPLAISLAEADEMIAVCK